MFKKQFFSFSLSFFFLVQFGIKAQDIKTIVFNPERPQVGQTIDISYNPSGTVLEGKRDISAVVYTFRNYVWEANDLDVKLEAGSWKGKFLVPSNCGMLAVKYKSDKLSDSGNDGYVVMIKDSLGKQAPGAYAAWGLLRSPNYWHTIPEYFDPSRKGVSDTVTYYWLNQEISFNPVSKVPMVYLYTLALNNAGISDRVTKINRAISFLLKENTEETLLKAAAIYRTVLWNKATADSLDQLMLQRFPRGAVARRNAYNLANMERDLKKKTSLFKQFLNDFPESDSDWEYNDNNRISYDNIYQTLIIIGAINHDYGVLNQYLNKLSFSGSIGVYYKIIQISHDRKDRTDKDLLPYSAGLVSRMEELKSIRPVSYRYLSPKEWETYSDQAIARNLLITHVNILSNAGSKEDALHYAIKAQSALNYTNASLNGDMALLLQQKGDKKLLHELLVNGMVKNQATPQMIDMLRVEYLAENKPEDGFNAYMESLKGDSFKTKVAAVAEESKVKGPMPEWSMYDADGKLVRSADLKGKTYVLDFWASWCVPCKASFPGMKLVVEKYKNDPDVAFFFVDTEERSVNYKEEINKYIRDNNYPFRVLFDNKIAGAKINDEVFLRVCKAFSISGIPQKIFVDKNGNVRFISVGYKGSASQLADDIAGMVEQTKNSK